MIQFMNSKLMRDDLLRSANPAGTSRSRVAIWFSRNAVWRVPVRQQAIPRQFNLNQKKTTVR